MENKAYQIPQIKFVKFENGGGDVICSSGNSLENYDFTVVDKNLIW